MNLNPRCTVVIPTYNCLEYLRSAVMTVAIQHIEDIEMIVVDDGSTDGTGRWLREYARPIPWLRILDLPGGSGPSRARNSALSIAKGKCIAFLDADDLWWPGKLAAQLQHHEANRDVTFSFTDYVHFDTEGALHGTCFDFWKPGFINKKDRAFQIVPEAELEILAANIVGTSTVIADARALQNANGFPEFSRSAEDWKLWLNLAAAGPVGCSSAVTTSYLMRPASVTANRPKRIGAMRTIVSAYDDRAGQAAQKARRRAYARIQTAEAEYHRQKGENLRAAAAHASAFCKWPDMRTARATIADIRASLLPKG